ncbi:hypothetical protein ADK67_15025, partial [Saccharothrix sp. NRRL B-16348]|uniref:beta-galactosidase n=1 Tax=Saccharothrix sp. NRRL B-16348 TaxID=1415542 RepID=UPI0006BF0BC7
HYTHGEDPSRYVGLAFSADLVRGLAGGRPWVLMENSTSARGQHHNNIAQPTNTGRTHTLPTLGDDASPYERYVEAGGRVLGTFLSGVSDSPGPGHLRGFPGA